MFEYFYDMKQQDNNLYRDYLEKIVSFIISFSYIFGI